MRHRVAPLTGVNIQNAGFPRDGPHALKVHQHDAAIDTVFARVGVLGKALVPVRIALLTLRDLPKMQAGVGEEDIRAT